MANVHVREVEAEVARLRDIGSIGGVPDSTVGKGEKSSVPYEREGKLTGTEVCAKG